MFNQVFQRQPVDSALFTSHTHDGVDTPKVAHANIDPIGVDDHHDQVHALISTDHPETGLTIGHFLKATATDAYAFGAHGLTNSDFGALAESDFLIEHNASGEHVIGGIQAAGDLFYDDGSTMVRLATDAGKFLQANAGTGLPEWVAVPTDTPLAFAVEHLSGGEHNFDGFVEETAMADGDVVPFYDLSAVANRKGPMLSVYNYVRDKLSALGYIKASQVNLLPNSKFSVCSLSNLYTGGSGVRQTDLEIGAAVHDDTVESADGSAAWTKLNCTMVRTNSAGAGAGGSNYYYTLTHSNSGAGAGRVHIAMTGLTIGKAYKFTVYIKNGTGSWGSNSSAIFGCDSGCTYWILAELITSATSWTEVGVVFVARSTTDGFGLYFIPGTGATVLIDNPHFHEVGPGFSGADVNAPDFWSKTTTLKAVRVSHDATHLNNLYGLKVTKGANTAEYLNGFYDISAQQFHVDKFRSRTVTFGCWVYSVTASDNVKLVITDSDGATASAAFCAADTLTFMTVTRSCGATITSFAPSILFDGDTSDVAYVSGAFLTYGETIDIANIVNSVEEYTPLKLNFSLRGIPATLAGNYPNFSIEDASVLRLPKTTKTCKAYAYVSSATAGAYYSLLDYYNKPNPHDFRVGVFNTAITNYAIGDILMKRDNANLRVGFDILYGGTAITSLGIIALGVTV